MMPSDLHCTMSGAGSRLLKKPGLNAFSSTYTGYQHARFEREGACVGGQLTSTVLKVPSAGDGQVGIASCSRSGTGAAFFLTC